MIIPSNSFANDDGLKDTIFGGIPYLEMRYRLEYAEKSDIPKDAYASTLRTRIGYKTPTWNDLSGVFELQNVAELGNDIYNNSINGKTRYAPVTDVSGTRINQIFATYAGIKDTNFRIGREALILDNQRWIGIADWRQEGQTIDLASITNTTIPDTSFYYAYLDGINRVTGERAASGSWESKSHVVNIHNNSLSIGTLTSYGYLLDFKDSPLTSSKTFGMSLVGKQDLSNNKIWNFGYRIEVAHQSDYAQNTVNYNASYYHLVAGIGYSGWQNSLALEVLGSDNGQIGVSTPLSSVHGFNGWSDVLVNTPKQGIRDLYFESTYTFNQDEGIFKSLEGILLSAQYHHFDADYGGGHLGNEIDFHTNIPLNKHLYMQIKYANYQADDFSYDVQRAVFGVGMKY